MCCESNLPLECDCDQIKYGSERGHTLRVRGQLANCATLIPLDHEIVCHFQRRIDGQK